jgi:hypothetical protein
MEIQYALEKIHPELLVHVDRAEQALQNRVWQQVWAVTFLAPVNQLAKLKIHSLSAHLTQNSSVVVNQLQQVLHWLCFCPIESPEL